MTCLHLRAALSCIGRKLYKESVQCNATTCGVPSLWCGPTPYSSEKYEVFKETRDCVSEDDPMDVARL